MVEQALGGFHDNDDLAFVVVGTHKDEFDSKAPHVRTTECVPWSALWGLMIRWYICVCGDGRLRVAAPARLPRN